MKQIVSIALVLSMLLLGSMLLAPALAAPPAIARPMEIIEATIDGGSPQTLDPAAAYDTASGEILFNVYDTLIFFNGEHMDQYLPQLADTWVLQNSSQISLGYNNELPINWRYTFHIRTDKVPKFTDIAETPVTPADVEYCIEREMYMDFAGGPQWMFYEPLLYNWGMLGLNVTNLDGNATEQARCGSYIDNAIESNDTHVWFNICFPGSYAPFMQILSQCWASVYSKAWCIGLGRAGNWDGVYANWFASWNPSIPPLDTPTPVMLGSGPFILDEIDMSGLGHCSLLRNHNYWRLWPLDWPAGTGTKPAGYIEHFYISWAWDWNTRSAKFLAGETDYVSVPRQYISQVVGQPGVRCTYPLPSMAVDAAFFNQNVDPASPYGTIYDYGVLGENGIPRDFLSDVHVRKAIAYSIDYVTFLNTAYLGEAMQPATCIIPGLPYYDASIVGYSYNLVQAEAELALAWGGQLPTTGFTMALGYNTGNIPRQTMCNMIKASIESIDEDYHCEVMSLPFGAYLYARDHAQLTCFILGWLADYPDAHNFAYAFYYSYGNFAWRASYSDPAMDALIEAGIATPDGPARQDIYSDIQQLAIDTCPSVALDQAIGRHFERDWVVGWYYNPIYTGNYPANCWKWYYTPHAQLDNPVQPTSTYLPYDVNYDGAVDMKDIGACAKSFGAIFGPPMSSNWLYRCDLNNDRKIDMKDIGTVAKNFGKTSAVWVAGTYP